MLHHALTLPLNADSAECCPVPRCRHLLAVGTYQLDEATRTRHGRLLLFSLQQGAAASAAVAGAQAGDAGAEGAAAAAMGAAAASSATQGPCLQQQHAQGVPGILDMKWAPPAAAGAAVLGAALADGTLRLYAVEHKAAGGGEQVRVPACLRARTPAHVCKQAPPVTDCPLAVPPAGQQLVPAGDGSVPGRAGRPRAVAGLVLRGACGWQGGRRDAGRSAAAAWRAEAAWRAAAGAAAQRRGNDPRGWLDRGQQLVWHGITRAGETERTKLQGAGVDQRPVQHGLRGCCNPLPGRACVYLSTV